MSSVVAWVVIDRRHLRQSRKSRPIRVLHLPSSPSNSKLSTFSFQLLASFSSTFQLSNLQTCTSLSPLFPTPYGHPYTTAAPQPLCSQSVTHSFCHDGGCTPLSSQKGTRNDSRSH